MTRPLRLSIAASVVVLWMAGCTPRQSMPTVAWRDPAEAKEILARRAVAVQTVSAQGLITLVRPDGESVRMDLAMVRAGREKVRIRAWKLGTAVFDLTMNPNGVWLLTAENASFRNKARSAGLTARKLAENLSLLGGDLFLSADLEVRETTNLLQFDSPAAGDGTHVRCEVDRRTLLPRRYLLLDSKGTARFTLELSDYRLMSGDIPFPCRYVAISDDGRILIALREVELNTELAASAFVPPRRAEKLP